MARGVRGTAGLQCRVDGCTSDDLAVQATSSSGFRSLCKKHHAERVAQTRYRPNGGPPQFQIPELPDELPPIDELLDRRDGEFTRRDKARSARRLISVPIFTE